MVALEQTTAAPAASALKAGTKRHVAVDLKDVEKGHLTEPPRVQSNDDPVALAVTADTAAPVALAVAADGKGNSTSAGLDNERGDHQAVAGAATQTTASTNSTAVFSSVRGDSKAVDYTGLLSVLVWLLYIGVAALYSCVKQDDTGSAKPRDSRWDAVRTLSIALVVYAHLWGHWNPRKHYDPSLDEWANPAYVQVVPNRMRMPAFAFVSGVFASGTSSLSDDERQVVILKREKLIVLFRDLLANSLTLALPGMLAATLTGVSSLPQPMIEYPEFWYLGALFTWQILTPFLCMMSRPVTFATIISVGVRGQGPEGIYMYFVYFVLGYVFCGGNASATVRSGRRKQLEELFSRTDSRLAAVCIMATFIGTSLMDLPKPLYLMFVGSIERDVTPWAMGGVFMDLAQICFALPVLFSFMVLCFIIPQSNTMSFLGSRTLYVYTLHNIFLADKFLATMLIESFTEAQLYFVYFAVTVVIVGILSCPLTVRIAGPLVQPQWLVDILFGEPAKDSALTKGTGA
eukprot:TRINITY_DN16878_c0_g1_i1.p1 TRINITY_DN16878_c0_g1~~TRINITY_DN16878_c0_g1_i1.p1  ORF type:complete len:517 (-),score=52.09 TRINITY_DN16878_c0_g1_i1:169-1719(-)